MSSRAPILLAFVIAPLLATTVGGQGERARDGQRIVVLQGTNSDVQRDLLEGFKRRIEQGGRRVDLDVLQGDVDGASEARLAREHPADLVVALGSRALAQATRGWKGTPAIGTLVARESAIPEGSSATAVVLEFPFDVEFEVMHRIVPKAKRIGVLYGSEDNARLIAQAREAARAQGLELIARRVASPAELPAALATIAGDADVLWGIPDDVVLTAETAKAVLLFSLRNRLPFIGLSAQWVKAGALYALDRDYTDLGAQTAEMAVRVLEGTPPRSIPAVRPRRSLYVINARSADMMRITFSPEVLRGAREIVR